ncbi:hypothetical protein [Fervidibacter sacchari]
MTAKGKVKGNIVVLDEGEKLPDGARVEVRVVEEHLSAEEAIRHILGNPITKPLGMLEILREDRREREERFDQWMKPEPD